MTDVEKIYTLLQLLEDKSKRDEQIIVSSMQLSREGLNRHDVRETMATLSSDESRKCIKVLRWPDFSSTTNTDDIVYEVELLPNFYDVLQKYHEYYLQETDPDKAAKLYPRNDLKLSERDFAEGEPDPERIKYEVRRSQVKAKIIMPGREVIMQLADGTEIVLKTLRVGLRPYTFMQFLLWHPNVAYDLAAIQDEVAGCKSLANISDLVGDCGFDKELKKAFFPVIGNENVRFKPNGFVPQEIVTQLIS
jgi:hypothetical protein